MALYALTEEQPNIAFAKATQHVLEQAGHIPKNSCFDYTFQQKNSQQPGRYEFILTLKLHDAVDINIHVALISPAKQNSFVDVLYFEGEEFPNPDSSIPFACVEITKNTFKESGNMTDQRSAKFIPVRNPYPNIQHYYFIHNDGELKLPNEGTNNHRALRRMVTMGVSVVLSDRNGIRPAQVLPYNTVQDFRDDIAVKGRRSNKVLLKRHRVDLIVKKLFKWSGAPRKNKGPHDPNHGWVASMIMTIMSLGVSNAVNLEIPQREVELFKKSKGKLKKNLYYIFSKFNGTFLLNGEEVDLEPPEDSHYWKYTDTGEKISTIDLSLCLVEKGYELIFENHAGCEKSFFRTSQGENMPFPKKHNEEPIGIPDLIAQTPNKDKLLVIEGENHSNYNKGVKQLEEDKMENTIRFLKEHYPEHAIATCLSLYGRCRPEDGKLKQYCFHEVFSDNSRIINEGATALRTIN